MTDKDNSNQIERRTTERTARRMGRRAHILSTSLTNSFGLTKPFVLLRRGG
jgi:hypothetical protein